MWPIITGQQKFNYLIKIFWNRSYLKKYKKEVDRYYKEEIHTKYNCYILKDFFTTQKIGYSDIEGRLINYNIDKLHCDKPFDFADHEIMNCNLYQYKLKLNYPEKDILYRLQWKKNIEIELLEKH